ncbi:PAS domain S-box protein [Methanoregula sp.]|uniref:PAS domain S-box protein n=1 Tax=Methanoregula sp. TaxID=2052170 RepID=UPI00356418BB
MAKINVLYVDDEKELLEIAKIFLEVGGELRIDTTPSPADALEILSLTPYDAIISDYQMPGLNGIDFLKLVREKGYAIPFILFTGRGREEVVIEAFNQGADFYLQKGGDPKSQFVELAHKIRLAVSQRRAEQALSDSEERFRGLTENSLDTIMLFDRDLRHLYVNPNIEPQTGISAAQFVGKTHEELGFPKDLVDLWKKSLLGVFSSGKTGRIEFQLPNGIWIDWLIAPVKGSDGSIQQVITSARDITERRNAEEQIRLAEFSLEHSGITTFWLDENARVVRANLAACKALGYTLEEFASLTVHDFDPNFPANKWKEIWDRIAQEKNVVIESYHKRKDGVEFPVEIASSYFEYGGRKLIFSFARDISDRREAELALRESEAKYRTLFEKSKDATFIADNDGFVDCNAAALAMLGMERKDQLLRLHPSQISPKLQPDGRDSLEKSKELMAEALREGSYHFEWVHLKLNGEPFWAEVTLTVIPIKGQQILHTILRDITDRKMAEEELRGAYEQITASEEELRESYNELSRREQEVRESEHRLADIINFAPDATIAIDDKGSIIAWNQAMEFLTGVPARSVLGKGNYEYALPIYGARRPFLFDLLNADRSELERLYFNIYRDGNTLTAETSLPRIGGESRTLWIKASPLYDEQGQIVGAIESMRDITERRNAEDALREREALFHGLFDQAFQLAGVLDLQGRLLQANATAMSLIGTDGGEVIGKPFWETPWWSHDPLAKEKVREAVSRAGRGEIARFETTHNDAAGNVHYIDFTLKPVVDDHGTILALLPEGRDITDAKRAESESADREKKFRILFDLAPYTCTVMDMEGHYLLVNRAFEESTGFATGEVLGKTSRELGLLDADTEKTMHLLLEAEGRLDAVETHMTTRAGVRRQVVVSTRKVLLGNSPQFISVTLDITLRKEAEKAVRKSEEKYRGLFENAVIGIFLTSPEGRLLAANTAFARMFGYDSCEQIMAEVNSVGTQIYADPLERIECLKLLTAHGKLGPRQVKGKKRDGSPLWVSMAARVIRDGTDNILSLEGTVVDITDRKMAEDALKESEQRFRQVFERSPLGIALVGKDFRLRIANPAFNRMLGYGGDELAGKTFMELTHPEDLPANIEDTKKLWAGEIESFRTNKRYLRKDGTLLHATVTVFSIRDDFGDVLYTIPLIEEIPVCPQDPVH